MADVNDSEAPRRAWIEKPAQTVGGRRFRRYVVKTHLVKPHEPVQATLLPYLKGWVHADDIVLLSEKIVAISEGRAVPLHAIRVGRMARWLSRHVGQLGYGLGLRRPETMQMAIREAGLCRITLAAMAGAFDRFSGRSGDFYRVAGRRVAAIDGPGPATIEPYNRYVVLAPMNAKRVAEALSRRLSGATVAVVDVNDVGSEVLALYGPANPDWIRLLTHDNLMGQGRQGTPVAVLQPIASERRSLPWTINPPVDEVIGSASFSWPGLGQGESEIEIGLPNCI